MLQIHFTYFLLSFAIGIFVVYVITPPPEVVIKFPSPYNVGKVVYKDKANSCYEYTAEKVSCTADKSLVKPQPIMEDFTGQRARV